MRKHLTDKDIKETLRRLTVICDTREQSNSHITSYFDKNKIPYVSKGLETGDYSFMLDDYRYDDEIVIERKNSLTELAANFADGRTRFENEFLRAAKKGTKIWLLVENGSWEAIKNHEYRSQFTPKSFIGSLETWEKRHSINIRFCTTETAGEHIYRILYYWLKERL